MSGKITFHFDDGFLSHYESEWMQPEGCEKYGSDNALWLTRVMK